MNRRASTLLSLSCSFIDYRSSTLRDKRLVTSLLCTTIRNKCVSAFVALATNVCISIRFSSLRVGRGKGSLLHHVTSKYTVCYGAYHTLPGPIFEAWVLHKMISLSCQHHTTNFRTHLEEIFPSATFSGVGTLLGVEYLSFENRSRGCGTHRRIR